MYGPYHDDGLYSVADVGELDKVVPRNILENQSEIALGLYKETNKQEDSKTAVITAIKYYTDNIGTLAYRNPSLYELDEKSKMP